MQWVYSQMYSLFMQELVDAGSEGLKLIARAAFKDIWIVSFLSTTVSLAFVLWHVCIWRSLENGLRSQAIDLINIIISKLRKIYWFCSSCPFFIEIEEEKSKEIIKIKFLECTVSYLPSVAVNLKKIKVLNGGSQAESENNERDHDTEHSWRSIKNL